MAVRGEGNAGLIVQDVGQSHGQGVVRAVHDLLQLCIHTGLSAVDTLFVCNAQLLQLVGSQNQLVAFLALSLQTEQSLDINQSLLEGGAVFNIICDILVVELLEGDLLILQQGQVGVVVGTCKTDGQTAGFVVAGDQDQSLVSMVLCKVDGNLDSVSQSHGIVDRRCSIVGMTAQSILPPSHIMKNPFSLSRTSMPLAT